MTYQELFQAGRLNDAIGSATDTVKRDPGHVGAREYLASLLCFTGQWDRADAQLDALSKLVAGPTAGVSLVRQLVRAEVARQQVFAEGRLPEFIGEPPDHLQRQLQVVVALREGNAAEARQRLDEVEQLRPRRHGRQADKPFADISDVDDRLRCVVEVLTSTGKYFWISWEVIDLVELRRPERPLDHLWQPAHMIVRGGPDGEVYLPVVYPGTTRETDEELLLGRATDWFDVGQVVTEGVGQRFWRVGGTDTPISQVERLEFPSN